MSQLAARENRRRNDNRSYCSPFDLSVNDTKASLNPLVDPVEDMYQLALRRGYSGLEAFEDYLLAEQQRLQHKSGECNKRCQLLAILEDYKQKVRIDKKLTKANS